MFRRILILVISFSFILGSQAFAADLDGLILFFSFDEGSGDEARDGSGEGNDGEIDGAAWVDGKIGGALEFDGGSFVEVDSSDSLEELIEEMTVAVWIKPELSGSGWQGVVTKGSDGAEHFELLINTDGHVHTAQMFENGRGVADRPPAPTKLEAGEWFHLAVTCNANDGKWILYINGELQHEAAAGGNLVPDGKPLVVGDEQGASRFFQGVIDEVAVFTRALSQDEVQELMGGIGDILSVEPVGKAATTWASIKNF